MDLDDLRDNEATAEDRRSIPWRPKLVALDVDGTLVEPGSEVHPAVVAAVRQVVACGAFVVLATGRSTLELRTLAETLGLTTGDAVCSNGAVTVSLPDWEVIEEVTFDARTAVHLVLDHVPGARIAVEHPEMGYLVTERFPEGELHSPQHIESMERILATPVTRVIVREPDSTPEEFTTLVERIGLRGVSYAVGYKAWLDIGPVGVTKGHAVERIATRLGIGAPDCLAIGDGRNDIEMLQWAGRGVAMRNAPLDVRYAADAVAESVTDLGAAAELERWYPRPVNAPRASA